MPAEVKILVEGSTNADSVAETGEEKTQPTITLVRDGDVIMVVDPGILESQQVLIDALQKEDLTVQDVNVVCITHSHIDHYRNVGMFPNAKTLEFFGLWEKNTAHDWKEQFSPDIQIMRTPGHDYTGITLFVQTKDGVVAICGDIFWRENYPQDPQDDAFASDIVKLKQSRESVLRMADWIVPGHAGMYKNNRARVLSGFDWRLGRKKREPRIVIKCKKCGREMDQKDRCQCRPYICFRCCECGFDCPICGCSHKK